jgi:hypothetical protein|eukprot:SAG25_NODE_124_length_14606_cov_739.419177_3_plen_90_part_00
MCVRAIIVFTMIVYPIITYQMLECWQCKSTARRRQEIDNKVPAAIVQTGLVGGEAARLHFIWIEALDELPSAALMQRLTTQRVKCRTYS